MLLYSPACCVPQEKLDAYVREGDLKVEEREQCMEVFEHMANVHQQTNLHSTSTSVPPNPTAVDAENRPLTIEELRDELSKLQELPTGDAFSVMSP